MHSCAYNKVIPWYRNIAVNSEPFWDIIAKIGDLELTDDRVIKLYKNKFPVFNFKRFLNYTWNDMIGKRSMGPPTVSNPGRFDWNRPHYKHRVIRANCGSNPAIGFGAPYLLTACTVKGVDELTLSFNYGTQYFSKAKASQILHTITHNLKNIASASSEITSKL